MSVNRCNCSPRAGGGVGLAGASFASRRVRAAFSRLGGDFNKDCLTRYSFAIKDTLVLFILRSSSCIWRFCKQFSTERNFRPPRTNNLAPCESGFTRSASLVPTDPASSDFRLIASSPYSRSTTPLQSLHRVETCHIQHGGYRHARRWILSWSIEDQGSQYIG